MAALSEENKKLIEQLKAQSQKAQTQAAQYKEKEANANAAYAEQKNQQSAEIASRLDGGSYATNTGTQQAIVEEKKANQQSAEVASRLDTGSYETNTGKQAAIVQKAKDDKKSAQTAANLDNSLMGQATRDNQKASFERAMESLYNQMEIAKSANQTAEYERAQKRYSDFADKLQELNNPTSTAAYAADWEAKQRTEIMEAGGADLMRELSELADMKVLVDTEQQAYQFSEVIRPMSKTWYDYQQRLAALRAQYGNDVMNWLAFAERADNKTSASKAAISAQQAGKDAPVLSSIASVGTNLLGGAGIADVAVQKLQRSVTGSDIPVDYNRAAQLPSQLTTNFRQGASEDMGATGKFLYNTGMSMLDTASIMASGGVGTVLLGGSAATNAMQEAVQRGASDEQALTTGLVAGAMEAVMEKMSIDKLFGLKTPEAARKIVWSALKQAGAEGVEEGLTTIANTAADALVMGNRSELQTHQRELMALGYSEAEAEKMALKEWGKNLALDVAGGAFSGGVFGGVKSGIDYGKHKSVADVMPKPKQQAQAQPPVSDITPTPQQPTVESVMPTVQPKAAKPIQQQTETEAEELPMMPGYGEVQDEGILVYRGYNRSTDGKERNLARTRSIGDVLGRAVGPETELLPLVYYTDSMEDAEGYAKHDFSFFEMLKEKYGEEQALETYKILTGRDEAKIGEVLEHRINPKKVMDLTELGEQTNADSLYNLLSRELGIPVNLPNSVKHQMSLDSILTMGGDDDTYPTYMVMKNRSGVLADDAGSRFIELLQDFGYDTIKYREDGANHYAVISSDENDTTKSERKFRPSHKVRVKSTGDYYTVDKINDDGTISVIGDYSWDMKKYHPSELEMVGFKPLGVAQEKAPSTSVDDIMPNLPGKEQDNKPAMGAIGDMGAKTSDFRHEVKESQSKTTPYYYEKNNVPEEGRADNRYTVVHRDESLHNARSRLEQDYDGEAADLRRKTTWSDEEMLEGDLILRKLREEAEQTGDWSKHREWAKVFKEHKTEAGRSLSVLAMLNNETGDAILTRAAETLEHATKGTDKDAVMQTTAEYATKFDAAVAEKNVDELVNIIKETARTRKTGFYSGKLGKLTSLPLDAALNRIANYAKAEPAAGTVTAPQTKAFQVGDVVIPSDRGNFGRVVKVNDDGTYDVHFKAKTGHEATKTFAAAELKSPHTGGVTASDISTDPGSAFEFLKSFAAAGIENIANDTNRASVVEMAKTIRRNAMLSKCSTIMRNLVGNGAFDIADTVARDISVPLDMLLSKITGTRSVAADYGWLSKAKRKGMLDGLAMAMLETSLDVNARDQQSKYENGSQRTFKMSGGVVSKLLSTWEGVMGYGLYVTDEMSKGATSSEVQRGLNRLYEKGKIKDDSLKDGGAQEALYRTFQDDTALSRLSTGMRDALNEVPGLGDAMIPFAQVPANLADRAIEYSPAGLTKSIYKLTDALVKAKKGTLTAAEQAKAVQTLGRNITGSGLIALAATLAARGLIHVVNPGGEDENKDKAASEKAQGLNGTQWNLSATLRDINGESTDWQDGDILMSIAFLEPFNAHLTIGAMLAEDLEAEGQLSGKTILRDTFTGSLTAIGDLPMFDAFGEAVNAYRYSDKEREGEKWLDAGMAMGANVVGSVMPNAAKGIAQGLDPYQRDLYSKDTFGGQIADQFRSVFDRDSLPIKQDSYGNNVENPDQPLNFLNANILPGAITKYTETDLQKALNGISKQTGSDAVYLSKNAPESITVDGEKFELTKAQQMKFMAERGDTYEAASAALENDETYQGFSKEWKLKAYEYAEDYATQMAKDGLGTKFEPSDWISDLEGKSPEEVSEALVQKVVEHMAGKAGENKYLGLETLLEDKSIDDQMALACMSSSCYDAYTTHCEKADISVQQFLDVYGSASVSGETAAEKKQAALDIIKDMDLNAQQKGTLAQAVHEAIGSFAPVATEIPERYLLEIGDIGRIESQMGTEQREKYNTYIKGSSVKMQTYLDMMEYYGSDAAKTKKDANGDPIKGQEARDFMESYIGKLNISDAEKGRLYCGVYAEKDCPKEWAIAAFGIDQVVSNLSETRQEKYNTYIKGTDIDPMAYFDLVDYYNSDESDSVKDKNGKAIKGESKQDHVIDWISKLNIPNKDKGRLFCTLYSSKNCPSNWR